MLGHNAICESPLCSLDFIHHIVATTPVTLISDILAGYIIPVAASTDLTVTQAASMAFGFDITHSIAIDSTNSSTGVYGQSISHALVLTQANVANMVYAIAVTDPVYIDDTPIQINNVYNIEICDGLEIYTHLGWVIELEASNTISCTVEEVQAAFTELVINQSIETNMDDVNCLQPGGKATEYGPSTAVNVAQSLNGQMIYACHVESNMSLLSSVAWR